MQLTAKTRIKDESAFSILDEMAVEYSSIKRRLFAEITKGKKNRAERKREFIAQFQITARQFNSMWCEVNGSISSVNELKKLNIKNFENKIKSLKKKLSDTKSKFKSHHWKRKLAAFQARLKKLKASLKDTPSICFGGKKLFRKQFNLKENGYKNHEDWKKDWNTARNSQFFLIGSKDESFGNQSCQMLPGKLVLRLTNGIAARRGFKTIQIPCEFSYQKELIHSALLQGQAMTYRFVKEGKKWYVLLSTEAPMVVRSSDFKNGALGIDLNPACLAMTRISSDGNWIQSWQVPVTIQGRTQEQIEATLGEEISKIVEYSKSNQLPIVIEDLDFSQKKFEMNSRGTNRMLSHFAYSKFATMIHSRCYKDGIELFKVNPAYTSVIGKYKFSLGYGLSSHCAAAMAIARRGFVRGKDKVSNSKKKFNKGFSERLRMKAKSAFDLPARIGKIRNDSKHVWSDWGRLSQMAKKVDSENYHSFGRLRPERSSGEFISSVLIRLELKPPRRVRKNEAANGSSPPCVSQDDRSPGVNDSAA
ncbi:MAG: IS200/IS605 family accessory protein TnpB-related protein [Bdellovibrionia bacterium]